MTDTAAREEAVERVRALAQGAIQPHEWGYRDPVVGGFVEDRTPFDLADHVLRLLLSGGEGGRLDAEPRLHVESEAGCEPGRWRKKPVVIDAWLLSKENAEAVQTWAGASCIGNMTATGFDYLGLNIKTLEGTMFAEIGDWIIKGVKGEFYPCKPDIFAATYEPAALTDPRQPSEAPVTADEKLMNRDREAIAEILFGLKCPELAQHFTYAAFREKTGPVPGVESALAALIALPVGGGVEVDLMMAERALDRWYQTQPRTGPNVSRDRHDMMEALRAALSPRSADGLCSLAAKDGAAAPPQAPVAGSEVPPDA
jgi:hypothetical protein